MRKVGRNLLVLAMMGCLVACGGSKTAPTEAAKTEAAKAEATTAAEAKGEETTAAAQEASDADKFGGTIVLPMDSEPSTLVAWKMRNDVEDYIASILYEPLLKCDENGAPQPYLVDDFIPDAEALTYTIKVKPGVKFHDGSDLDAEAIKWNIDNYVENGILTSSFYSNVESVEIVDESTVVIHMSAWDSLLPYAMTRTCFMSSQKAFEEGGEAGLEAMPVGTGAFKFDSWEHGTRINFVRFDDYWQGKPYLDGVKMEVYSETLVAQAAMEMGELHAMPSTDFDVADEMSGKGYGVIKSAIPAKAFTLNYNSAADGPLKDVRVRQAISYAINGQVIVDTLCSGYAEVSNQWALEGTEQYNDELKGYEYDPEAAKKLLAEAGYPDGFETTLTVRSYDLVVDTAQILIEQLAEVGIKVNLNPIEPANYSTYLSNWDGLLLHTMGVSNSQYSQMSACFVQGVTTGLGVEGFIHPDDTNEAIMKARSTGGEESEKMFREAVRLIFDEHCMVKPIFITYNVTVVDPKLHDSEINALAPNTNTLYKAWLEK